MKGLKFALTGLVLGAAWCASAEKLVTHGDTVAMMGDSITQYGTASNSGYPQLFLRAIRTTGVSDFTFVGAGVAGNTSTDMRDRFVRDVVNKNPTVVTINSGVNDIRFGFPAHYETYRDNLNYMVDQAKGVGAKVVLMTPTGAAGEGTNELVHALAGIMREVAADKHVTLADSYVYFRAAVEDPQAPAMDAAGHKATVDGLHMGPVGDRAMARSLVAVMGLTEAEIAAVEEDWNTAPIVGISGIPSMSLAQYDMVEAYSDRFKLEIWTAAGDAFHAGLARFLANPVIPAKPTLPAVPSGAASDCAGGAIVMCGGGAWGNEAQTNPSGISRLVTKALAANGSTRPVITGRADGEYLSKIDSNFDKIVANDKDTGAAVSHLVIMPGLENITTDTQSAQSIVSKAAAKGITVVFLTYNPLKDSDGDAELNTVLRDLDNGTTVRTIDAYQMRVDEKTRRAANANAHHYIHGNGTLSPRMNYLEGTELLPMLGFNTAAAQRADARWQAIDDFGGSTVSYSIGFGELDQLRAIAFQNNVSVAELYAVCMRLGAEAIADVAPVQGQLTVDPNTMSNNCALVANAVNRIRGTAAPGVRITVYRKGVTAVGYADANGDYYVDYNPGDYEPSYKTTVSDGLNTLTFYTTLVSSIPAHDHVYGTTNYTWSADYTACTAMATCSVCTEKLFENGAVTTVTNVAQTCTTDGSVTSTAVFPTLGTTTKSATVPAGHVWGAPGYDWNTTDWTCTASASCVRDGAHKASETVQAQYAVVTPATIYATGLGRYTATFANAAFASQTYDVEIPKKTGDEGLSPAGEGKDDSNAIQQAIDAAGEGGTVTLGEGTFLINTQLTIGNGVTLVGQGYDKTTLRNVAAQGSNSRVATISGNGVLSSVTVTGGAVSGANKNGGGVLINGDGTVTWCKVTGNKVIQGFGGGIGVAGVGQARIDHTTITGNTAVGDSTHVPYGAGIGVDGSTAGGHAVIDTCLVCGNVSGESVTTGCGGGISISGYNASVDVLNTTVADNSASGSAGGICLKGTFAKYSALNMAIMTTCFISSGFSTFSGFLYRAFL